MKIRRLAALVLGAMILVSTGVALPIQGGEAAPDTSRSHAPTVLASLVVPKGELLVLRDSTLFLVEGDVHIDGMILGLPPTRGDGASLEIVADGDILVSGAIFL